MNTTEAKRQIMLKQWAALIKEQQRSGLNKKTWCLEHGIKSGTFYYWQNLVRQAYLGQAEQSDTAEYESSSSELVKVDISQAPVEAPALPTCNSLAVNNKEIVQPQASQIEPHPSCIHLQYKGSFLDIPAGTKAEDLSEILKALAML